MKMIGLVMIEKYLVAATKRWKLKKSTVLLFLLYYILVIVELKDAYLIDQIHFSSMEIFEELLHYTEQYWQPTLNQYFSSSSRILIYLLGDDKFFLNERLLESKLAHQSSCSIPQIVDLNGSNITKIRLLSTAESDCMRDKITDLLLHPIVTRGKYFMIHTIDNHHPSYEEIGAPFIAGYLLGYPYIYWASLQSGEEAYRQASGLLSYNQLRRTSLILTVDHSGEGQAPRNEHQGLIPNLLQGLHLNQCSITEFTIPQSVVGEDSICFIDAWLQKRRRLFQTILELQTEEKIKILSGIQLETSEEVIETETISL